MERPLVRPPITYPRAFLLFCSATTGFAAASIAVFLLLRLLGVAFGRPAFFILSSLAYVSVLGRWFALLAIGLYQHYAPEEVRRRCLLKPTCSEYAAAVIKRYGLLVGGLKTWVRLNYKCRGDVYYIDEP